MSFPMNSNKKVKRRRTLYIASISFPEDSKKYEQVNKSLETARWKTQQAFKNLPNGFPLVENFNEKRMWNQMIFQCKDFKLW